MGLEPDLATVSKAIGSGMPVAALAGWPEFVVQFEQGRIARAGPYFGTPPACAAVVATMAVLGALDYPALLVRGKRLRAGIFATLRDVGVPACTSGHGSVFRLWFAEASPGDYAEAVRLADGGRSLALHLALRRRGLMTLRLPFGRMFLAAARDDADIEATAAALATAAAEIS